MGTGWPARYWRTVGGLDERADVGDDGGGVGVEESLDVGKVGVQGEVGGGAELEELVLRNG